jgi:hypothetical protein
MTATQSFGLGWLGAVDELHLNVDLPLGAV